MTGDVVGPCEFASPTGGTKELSPALQRWVRVNKRSECRRHGTVPRKVGVCRPYGTRNGTHTYPALKRWAKLLRAYGARILASRAAIPKPGAPSFRPYLAKGWDGKHGRTQQLIADGGQPTTEQWPPVTRITSETSVVRQNSLFHIVLLIANS
jgi:hypothetical protein